MIKCKEIKHEYNRYGYQNMTPDYSKSPYGIYQMQTVNDCTYLEVYCNPLSLDEVKSQIERHVDDVESVYDNVYSGNSFYVIEGDETSVYDSWTEALLNKLDPDEELGSLVDTVFTCTFSRKPDDIVKDSNTGRTKVASTTISGLIEELNQMPYIHSLSDNLTDQQKQNLYELSLRIQKAKGMEKETREVKL